MVIKGTISCSTLIFLKVIIRDLIKKKINYISYCKQDLDGRV